MGLIPRSAALVVAAVSVVAALDAVAADSTLDEIRGRGVLRTGVIDYPPNWYRNKQTGGWEGFMIDALNDIAKVLNVKVEVVETTWANMVLDLQAKKTDIQFGMQANPSRALAVEFAGPLYALSYIMINSKNFDPNNEVKTWDQYNNPRFRVSTALGAGTETGVRRFVPEAQHVSVKSEAEAIMMVQAGRADAFLTMTIAGLVAKAKNPDLGKFVVPLPVQSLPSYAGLRYENDRRWKEFIERWAEWNRLSGTIDKWIKNSMTSLGVNPAEIPPNLTF